MGQPLAEGLKVSGCSGAAFVFVHAKRAFVNTKSQPCGWDFVFLR